MELVSIGRRINEVKLFDSVGAVAKMHSSLTVDQQSEITKRYGSAPTEEQHIAMSKDMVCACFIEWNIGENGTVLPCTPETLSKLSMRDFFALLQSCTSNKLLDDEGNMLSIDEIRKKGKSE